MLRYTKRKARPKRRPCLIHTKKKKAKRNASSVNRTRASSMATMNSTTRPMMLFLLKSQSSFCFMWGKRREKKSAEFVCDGPRNHAIT
ncbi:hypothetical protein ASPWEDRAFT_412029 [Aspergillus wentii DTO 134E9]|uniref:Uncharacterized protein n=1 Tax=Aspergillus wentii DTO 134E9 TaxID=1073089 RepID=A0A1L9RNM4_ASPWE|nr:uncharacterized protein ASPWEDRAFT_412029 [Aspergillus wentii DTO 134E9]OJJ36536.1 hypothetical protein ASPWEDRAFT_412029 [Aspergillus wentii DTO 134E9]